jgi:hypothetical protein
MMKDLTRRTFIQSSTVLAAGAAVGIPASKIREHSPVDLRMYFFSSKPFTLKVGLHSDESKDLFEIRVLPFDKNDKPGVAHLSLSKVRAIVESRSPAGLLKMECKPGEGKSEQREMLISAANGDMIMQDGGVEGAPFSMSLADVRRVL